MSLLQERLLRAKLIRRRAEHLLNERMDPFCETGGHVVS
jgi:hypothetical protein